MSTPSERRTRGPVADTTTLVVAALDAGGTSTRCLLARADGTVLGRAHSGPGNHILSGWETARASIAAAIAQACAAARVEAAAVACAVAGSAGVGPNGEGAEIVETLLGELLPQARTRAVGDMVTGFWGALSEEVGVVVAAGTGSVGYGRNGAGESRQVGGWGHVMGDEGSAYDIAVRALRAGARATDGRGPHTALTARLAAALGVSDFMSVAFRVYGEPMPREAIARLAETVADTAREGDAVAQALLADAGEELGRLAVTLLQTLGLAATPVPVARTGAVFQAGELILDAFRRTVTSACPRAAIVAPEFPPVIGAFKLALRELGVAFTAETAGKLRRGLAEHP